MRVAGIVLCGGQSRRMGRPKAGLPFGNEVLLQRVVRLLGTVVDPIIVVAAPDQELSPLPPSVEIARDEEKGRGPLEGLAAGLAALGTRADAAYASACDVPFLKPAFVRRMINLLGDASICVPDVDGFRHPLAAVYRVAVLPHIRRLLGENRLRPVFLFDAVPTRLVAQAELLDVDPEHGSLRNLNTPEDYAAALQELQLHEVD